MNVHPILVHFPIALLSIYSLLELIRIKRIQNLPYWFYIKAAMVIIGSASTIPALLAGQLIEHQFTDRADLVETHSFWAELSTVIFGVIAICYVIEIVSRNNLFGIKLNGWMATIWQIKQKFAKTVLNTPIIVSIAILGLIAITITGALGGIIVYGPNLDPFTAIIYKIFIGN